MQIEINDDTRIASGELYYNGRARRYTLISTMGAGGMVDCDMIVHLRSGAIVDSLSRVLDLSEFGNMVAVKNRMIAIADGSHDEDD